MRTKLKITEGIFPMPVLMVATYNEDGSVNVMNAAWGTMPGAGLRCSEPHRDTQDRTEHQGTGSIHRQHCRCCPHSGSRLFRRRVRQ